MLKEAAVQSIPHQDITHKIIAAALNVYDVLGSGFNEAIYDRAMGIALQKQMLGFESQRPVDIYFEGTAVGLYYLDYLVEEKVVLELKAVAELTSSHLAQAISYLVATRSNVGLLVNFGAGKLEWRRVLPPLRARQRWGDTLKQL
jgi:GxxExxY protein